MQRNRSRMRQRRRLSVTDDTTLRSRQTADDSTGRRAHTTNAEAVCDGRQSRLGTNEHVYALDTSWWPGQCGWRALCLLAGAGDLRRCRRLRWSRRTAVVPDLQRRVIALVLAFALAAVAAAARAVGLLGGGHQHTPSRRTQLHRRARKLAKKRPCERAPLGVPVS